MSCRDVPFWNEQADHLMVRPGHDGSSAKDFVYHLSEIIDPFDEATCECGRPLEFGDEATRMAANPVHYDGRIHRNCPACGRPFRPQKLIAKVRDGRTGEVSQRAGGATYLFAVVIDCGKGFAREGWPIRATEEFRGTVTQARGRGFYEIGDVF